MKNKIDQIFNQSEHQKALDLRPELWDKLERRLDGEGSPKASKWNWMLAASILLIFSLSTLLYLNIDTYEVEDLSNEIQPYFSAEEISNLEDVYLVEIRLFVNPHLG